MTASLIGCCDVTNEEYNVTKNLRSFPRDLKDGDSEVTSHGDLRNLPESALAILELGHF